MYFEKIQYVEPEKIQKNLVPRIRQDTREFFVTGDRRAGRWCRDDYGQAGWLVGLVSFCD